MHSELGPSISMSSVTNSRRGRLSRRNLVAGGLGIGGAAFLAQTLRPLAHAQEATP